VALRHTLALALATVTVPSAVYAETPTTKAAPAKGAAKPNAQEAMALVTKFFDKLFPAGPEPDPVRLAAARQASFAMFPQGAYAEAVNGFTEKMADHVLNMSEADLADLAPPTAKGKNKKAATPSKPPSTEPLRLVLAKKDPMFDAKLAAGKAFAKTMIVKFGDVAEPKFREGLARTVARRFDAQQIADIQRFVATPTGAAYGRHMMGLWFEPEVMRSTFQAFPDMMKMMPSMMQDAAAFEQQMKAKPEPTQKPN
jgi:hypothetical protein